MCRVPCQPLSGGNVRERVSENGQDMATPSRGHATPPHRLFDALEVFTHQTVRADPVRVVLEMDMRQLTAGVANDDAAPVAGNNLVGLAFTMPFKIRVISLASPANYQLAEY